MHTRATDFTSCWLLEHECRTSSQLKQCGVMSMHRPWLLLGLPTYPTTHSSLPSSARPSCDHPPLHTCNCLEHITLAWGPTLPPLHTHLATTYPCTPSPLCHQSKHTTLNLPKPYKHTCAPTPATPDLPVSGLCWSLSSGSRSASSAPPHATRSRRRCRGCC